MSVLEQAKYEVVVPHVTTLELAEAYKPADDELLLVHDVTLKQVQELADAGSPVSMRAKPFNNRQISPWHWDSARTGFNWTQHGSSKWRFLGLASEIIRRASLPMYIRDQVLLHQLETQAVEQILEPHDLIIFNGFGSRTTIIHQVETIESPRMSYAIQPYNLRPKPESL